MSTETIGNFKDLDFDNIDFTSPFWSWNYVNDDKHKCTEIVYCDYDFNVIRYPLPHFFITIVERVRQHSVNKLKEQLNDLDETRKTLLTCTYKNY